MTVFSAGQGSLTLLCGDITQADTQAIVNAANPELAGGGGVDGAIHRAAGREALQKACRAIIARRGPLAPGEAVITPGFGLAPRHIIHTAGPVWRGGGHGEPQALAAAYSRCLELCKSHGLASVAFPAISCGVYGYPVELAAPIALAGLAQGLRQGLAGAAQMVLYSENAYQTWLGIARRIL